jgi:hypothetical protein
VIFDIDSTVLVVYGHQEQARIGYNPIKRGGPSYHRPSATASRSLRCQSLSVTAMLGANPGG